MSWAKRNGHGRSFSCSLTASPGVFDDSSDSTGSTPGLVDAIFVQGLCTQHCNRRWSTRYRGGLSFGFLHVVVALGSEHCAMHHHVVPAFEQQQQAATQANIPAVCPPSVVCSHLDSVLSVMQHAHVCRHCCEWASRNKLSL